MAMRRLWEDGESFLIVEHDIVIHDKAVRSMLHCPRPWCLYAYGGPPTVEGNIPVLDRSLGCTRFHRNLIAAYPALWDDVAATSDGMPLKDWRRLDTLSQSFLLQHGYQPHRHHPDVTHLHPY